MKSYYEIAKTAYCTAGDQWDCRSCYMHDYFEKQNNNVAECRGELLRLLVIEITDSRKESNPENENTISK